MVQTLADYLAAIARFDEGQTVVDNRGNFHHVKLDKAAPDLQRGAFPRSVQLRVATVPPPAGTPTGRLMQFGNNFLKSSRRVG
jgi:hypothetical protein